MNDSVTLRVEATPSAAALVLRPWRADDVPALVQVYRDPVLRHRTGSAVESEADALRWVRGQERGWSRGERFSFAVLAARAGSPKPELVGHAVLKEVAPCSPSAEVGYWTAAPARGLGVASRALEALTGWAFGTLAAGRLERLDLLHQEDNPASCRVALKSGYAFDRVLPAAPPAFPLDGHLHTRRRDVGPVVGE